jgi:hypothetical protein
MSGIRTDFHVKSTPRANLVSDLIFLETLSKDILVNL